MYSPNCIGFEVLFTQSLGFEVLFTQSLGGAGSASRDLLYSHLAGELFSRSRDRMSL
jgi:hypothetical protein